MKKTQAKRCKDSSVTTRHLIMPGQANPGGTAFGGAIMSMIDMTASMTAQRHCGKEVVTASIDSISFRAPINVGDHVVLRANVNYAGRTSMEVGVQVVKEDPLTGEQTRATTAHLTFVALDEQHKPTEVPDVIAESDDEKRWYENAKVRVQARKDLLAKMRKA